jgi:hypothetical protein
MTVAANVWAADPTSKNLDPNRQRVALWERETGLSYVRPLFPNVYRRHPERGRKRSSYMFREAPLRSRAGHLSTERMPCQKSHILQATVMPTGFSKSFLDQWHPQEGEMNGGTTDIWGAEPTTIWIPLLE